MKANPQIPQSTLRKIREDVAEQVFEAIKPAINDLVAHAIIACVLENFDDPEDLISIFDLEAWADGRGFVATDDVR